MRIRKPHGQAPAACEAARLSVARARRCRSRARPSQARRAAARRARSRPATATGRMKGICLGLLDALRPAAAATAAGRPPRPPTPPPPAARRPRRRSACRRRAASAARFSTGAVKAPSATVRRSASSSAGPRALAEPLPRLKLRELVDEQVRTRSPSPARPGQRLGAARPWRGRSGSSRRSRARSARRGRSGRARAPRPRRRRWRARS